MTVKVFVDGATAPLSPDIRLGSADTDVDEKEF